MSSVNIYRVSPLGKGLMFLQGSSSNQWEFQEPKLEVPTIYKAYIRSVLGVDHFMVSQGSLAVLLALAAILTTPVAAEIFGNWVIAMVLGGL